MLDRGQTSQLDPLERLLPGEREVLDLVLARHTTKEIARRLSLSTKGVDWRVRAARDKLGAVDRNDLARIYAGLVGDWGKTPVGPSPVATPDVPPLAAAPETPSQSRFVLHDAASFTLPAPWELAEQADLPEVLDGRLGKWWRIAAIMLGALAIALLALALIAIAAQLRMVI